MNLFWAGVFTGSIFKTDISKRYKNEGFGCLWLIYADIHVIVLFKFDRDRNLRFNDIKFRNNSECLVL